MGYVMFLSVLFICGIVGFTFISAAVAAAVFNVLATQFDELMPDRMVEYSGFVEIPQK